MNKLSPPKLSPKQKRDLARLKKYLEMFDRVSGDRDTDDPDWRTRSLLSVIDVALQNLAAALRDGKKVKWRSPFWAFQYPVQWDWEKWRWNQSELAMRYGELTSRNTRTHAEAMRSLAQISVRECIYVTLLHLTNEVSTYKKGRWQHPMMPEPLADAVRNIRGRKAQTRALEELFAPFSIGTAEIEIPDGLKAGQKIPRKLAQQLAERTKGMRQLAFPMGLNGHEVSVRIIFQVFPLTIDEAVQRAYFPITIGITLIPVKPGNWNHARPPGWLDPAQWREQDRRAFWAALAKYLRRAMESIQPIATNAAAREIEKTSASMHIDMEGTSPENLKHSAGELLETLRQKGFLTKFSVRTVPATVASKQTLLNLLQAVETSTDAVTKGAALEGLVTALLKGIPGFEIQKGVRTMTEEIDVKVLNSHPDPRWRDTPIILFECKNWSKVCGKNEVALFERKLENRRGRARLGFLISWGGFARTAPQELLRGSRGNTQIALLTADHLRTAVEHNDILPVLRDAVDRADAI